MTKCFTLLALALISIQPALADIVELDDVLYIVNPANGHASEIEAAPKGAQMRAVGSTTVRIGNEHYSALFSVNPVNGARTRIDLDRNAPESGMVKIVK